MVITLILVINLNISAKSSTYYLIPGGESIGLQINTGVYITGKFDVTTDTGRKSPWENSNIEKEDIIYTIDGKTVNSIKEIQNILSEYENGETIELGLIRNGKKIFTNIMVIANIDGKKSMGLYVKDNIVGVGTLTYIDPNNNSFGALGHSVSNNYSPNTNGLITGSSIEGIRKALPGIPGEKKAVLNNNIFGNINKNNNFGVFGNITDKSLINNEKMAVGKINEVKLGKAMIMTVTSKNEKECYEIEIIEVKKQLTSDIKGIKFKVVDEKLLEKTGGIIQGMSGSPIIQDNKIIGAVSHVIVDNPEYGYGVYIEWMLKNQ